MEENPDFNEYFLSFCNSWETEENVDTYNYCSILSSWLNREERLTIKVESPEVKSEEDTHIPADLIQQNTCKIFGDALADNKTHTAECPYKCETCGKCCSRKNDLTRHELTQSGECPYKCETCGKGFSDKS